MLSDSTVGKFLESTGENPIFAQVDLYDTPSFYRDDFEVPYARAQVAVLNCSRDLADDNVYARMAVLDVENIGTSYIYRQLSHGDYLTRDVADLEGSILEPTKDLKNKYADFVALHEHSPYVVHGCLYEPTKPNVEHVEPIPGTEREFDLEGKILKDGRAITSVDLACQWLLENQHAYIQGAHFSQHYPGDVNRPIPSGNFLYVEVPHGCSSYPDGAFETFENRRKYAEIQAQNFGTKIGGPTAEEILREQRSKERSLPVGPKKNGQKQTEDQLTLG